MSTCDGQVGREVGAEVEIPVRRVVAEARRARADRVRRVRLVVRERVVRVRLAVADAEQRDLRVPAGRGPWPPASRGTAVRVAVVGCKVRHCPFSASCVDGKPEQRRDDRRDGAGREHDAPAALRRRERCDEGRPDHAAEVAARVEHRRRRHRVVRREPHRDAPVVALVQLDAGEAEAERRDRPVGTLDRHGEVQKERRERQRDERQDARARAVAEARGAGGPRCARPSRRRCPRRRTAARRASRSRARTASGPARGTGSSRTSRGRRRSS